MARNDNEREWAEALTRLDDLSRSTEEVQWNAWRSLVTLLKETDNSNAWYSEKRASALIELLARLFRISGENAVQVPSAEVAWSALESIVTEMSQHLAVGRYGLEPSDADDIKQTVLMRLQGPEELEKCATSEQHPSSALAELVRSRARSDRRSQIRRTVFLSAYQTALLMHGERQLPSEHGIGPTRLSVLVQQLSAEDRDLLWLRFHGGFTIRQIAGMRDEGYSAVAKRLARLLASLREALEP